MNGLENKRSILYELVNLLYQLQKISRKEEKKLGLQMYRSRIQQKVYRSAISSIGGKINKQYEKHHEVTQRRINE